MEKLCCFFNYNPLYRFPIYSEMSRQLECDFYFGDSVFEPLKQFDPQKLKGFQKTLHTVRLFREYKWHKGVHSLLKGYSAYLITGQYEYLSYWVIIFYAKLTGKRIYCWTHGTSQKALGKTKERLINKLFFKVMDGILMYNSYRIPNMEAIGISANKLFVIHNSLDSPFQTDIYDKLQPSSIYRDHFHNDLPTVIYIGRIQKRKKIDLLVKAIAYLYHDNNPLNLVIVGKATQENDIEQLVLDKGIADHVWFYGPCFEEEKNAELLYNAAVCVCPAEVGLTAIHSLTYGTPVISNNDFDTQMPEFEAIINGETGSFYQAGDIPSLAQEIVRWSNKTTEERTAIRARARKEITTSWSINYQIDVLRNVFPDYKSSYKSK